MNSTHRISASAPPVANRIEHRELRHGETVVDHYHWLREKSNPDVIAYLEAENEYTQARTSDLEPHAAALYQEMLGRIKQTDLSVPVRRGNFYYFSRTEEGKQYSIHCRRKAPSPEGLEAREEIILDENALAQGHSFFSIGSLIVSDDHNLLAYTVDNTGFRQYTLRVKDLESGLDLPDSFPRITSLAWAADNRTLFLTTEDETTKRSDRLWRLTLGHGAPAELYHEPDELYRIHLHRTRDRRYTTLNIESTDTSEVRYLPSDQPAAAWKVFLPRENKHRYDIDHREGTFYIRTDKDAKNFRLMTAPAHDLSPNNWTELIAHRPDVLFLGIDLFKDFGVVIEKSNALTSLRVLHFASGQWTPISFPEPVYAAGTASNPEYDTTLYRYNYQSMVTPPSVYDYDLKTNQATLLKRQEVLGGYDPARYVTERLWATARDGVKVPLSVVCRAGFVRDGNAPLLLYAYGSYGIGMPAAFSSHRISLLDRGMAFVIAHVRGGNDMGESWHEDGMLMKKKNTFHDFIDSAEFLIREKWTSPDRLVIQGGSAGGLLMGAVVNLRPELFRAVHAAVPFVDVMNTMLDSSLPLTVGEYLEWGNPNEKEAYDYMRGYSPYDNLERRDYPAMLVTTSLNDSQVMYWEPAKYVARLRTLNTGNRPVLLKINMGAGHGGASGRYDRLKEIAFEYAWLMSEAGIALQ